MNSIALLIVHSDRIVRDTLSAVLMQHGQFIVVNTTDACGPSAVLNALREQRADVVLLDIALAQQGGPELIARMKRSWPEVKVLAMGLADRDADILGAFELGATGYVTQSSSVEELIASIRALMFGQTLCSARIANMLFARLAHRAAANRDMLPAADPAPRLTRREVQIVALIEAGLTNKEIGRRLSLEVQTVKNHVHNILEKLHVPRRVDAVRYARTHGLLRAVAVPVRVVRESPELDRLHATLSLGDDTSLER